MTSITHHSVIDSNTRNRHHVDMKERGSQRRRTAMALGGVTLLVAAALVYVLLRDLSKAANIASVIAAVAGVLALLPGLRDSEPRRGEVSTPDEIEKAERLLARKLLSYWQREIGVRQLKAPEPLVVRWKITDRLDVMDRTLNISPSGRLRFYVRTDRVQTLVREFQKLERQRLVVLGGPGMGKTTLVVLMLRELLERRKLGDPIPVFLSLSDWNVEVESLNTWIIRRLEASYPVLRAPEFGPTAICDLVEERRILPILDGLDEVAKGMRPEILNALNTAAESAVILTCRTKEYGDAVCSPKGRALIAAPVIKAEDLSTSDITEYLTRCLRSTGDPDWQRFFSKLGQRPLADALATPLSLWLLRKVYIDLRKSPETLLQYKTANGIIQHLLDEFIPALIGADRIRKVEHRYSKDDPFRARYNWDPTDAKRWLGHIANFLHSSGNEARGTLPEQNIAWWRLYQVVPARSIKVGVGVVAGAALGLAFGLFYSLVFAIAGAIVFLVGDEIEVEPRYANLRLRGRGHHIPQRIKMAFRFTLILGLVSIPVFWVMVGFRSAISVGLTYTFVGGTLFTLSDSIATPSLSDDRAITPTSTLRNDRAATAVHILAVGVTNSLALGIAFGATFGVLAGATWTLLAALGTSFEIPVYPGRKVRIPIGFSAAGTAWSTYVISKSYLAVRRKIPLRLVSFLDDCCRLGILKQEGPWYQFRHLELQNRLASLHKQPKDGMVGDAGHDQASQ